MRFFFFVVVVVFLFLIFLQEMMLALVNQKISSNDGCWSNAITNHFSHFRVKGRFFFFFSRGAVIMQ